MKVIDLFSGVGGFSQGFINEGYEIMLANEIDSSIAYSYKMNHPQTLMINKDIKEFTVNTEKYIRGELEKQSIEYCYEDFNNIDLIIGGPPCQGFSMAGARIRKKNEFIDDPRNYLFKYYYQTLLKFTPQAFVFENVPGLLSIENGNLLDEIVSIFKDIGYKVSVNLIDSSNYGVPQKRKRVFIVGHYKKYIDLKKELDSNTSSNKIVTLKEAIEDLNFLDSGEGEMKLHYTINPKSDFQKCRRANSEILFNHVAPRHNEIAITRIKKVLPGMNLRDMNEENIKSVHSGAYGRLEWEKPSPTITTRFDTPSAGRVIHPERHRALTAREAARIQTFDDKFIFYGNKTSIGKQIGNAVPPILAQQIARVIKNNF